MCERFCVAFELAERKRPRNWTLPSPSRSSKSSSEIIILMGLLNSLSRSLRAFNPNLISVFNFLKAQKTFICADDFSLFGEDAITIESVAFVLCVVRRGESERKWQQECLGTLPNATSVRLESCNDTSQCASATRATTAVVSKCEIALGVLNFRHSYSVSLGTMCNSI